jgi:hypothetical protein
LLLVRGNRGLGFLDRPQASCATRAPNVTATYGYRGLRRSLVGSCEIVKEAGEVGFLTVEHVLTTDGRGDGEATHTPLSTRYPFATVSAEQEQIVGAQDPLANPLSNPAMVRRAIQRTSMGVVQCAVEGRRLWCRWPQRC